MHFSFSLQRVQMLFPMPFKNKIGFKCQYFLLQTLDCFPVYTIQNEQISVFQ